MISRYYQEQINFEKNIANVNNAGYISLATISYTNGMGNISDENTVPVPYCYPDEIRPGVTERMSARLFMKEGSDNLYSIYRRRLINAEISTPAQAKDGAYIFIINLKKKNDDPADPELELEIRVMVAEESGHPQLIPDVYYGSIAAAGEFFVENGKMILCMDKTGSFNERLRARNINTDEVIQYCFSHFLKSNKYSNDGTFKNIYVPCRDAGSCQVEVERNLVKILEARNFNFATNKTIKDMREKHFPSAEKEVGKKAKREADSLTHGEIDGENKIIRKKHEHSSSSLTPNRDLFPPCNDAVFNNKNNDNAESELGKQEKVRKIS